MTQKFLRAGQAQLITAIWVRINAHNKLLSREL
jgi:hypothetical protein